MGREERVVSRESVGTDEMDTVVSASTSAEGFSGARTAEIVGISYRQLDYWARTDLVRPSLVDARGSGSRRLYSYTDLLELRVIKSLLDAGLRLESVREVFSFLRDRLGEDIASANLVIQGSNSVLIRSDGELIDLVRRGQGVLNILPLEGVRREMDARIRQLRPEASGSDARDPRADRPESASEPLATPGSDDQVASVG